ncbi:MAG: YwaF family protein [Clostridia bacterium]|nr:YwaF family protein [Clostridia bacterium]
MYSVQHIIWIGICIAVIGISLLLIRRYKPDEKTVFTAACVVCLLSEVAKVLSTVKMLPLADGSTCVPFIDRQELPLHLCSIQIIFILVIRFVLRKDSGLKTSLLGFMFPTMTIGALFAIFLPSVFSNIPASLAFIHPQFYQMFLFHAMLIVLGVYIYTSRFSEWKTKHYFRALGGLIGLAFIGIYINSLLAYVTVGADHQVASVERITNFFFVVKTPVGIALTEKAHWFIYLAIIIALAFVTVGLPFIPVFIRDIRARRAAKAAPEDRHH